jgi:hypothetical protein
MHALPAITAYLQSPAGQMLPTEVAELLREWAPGFFGTHAPCVAAIEEAVSVIMLLLRRQAEREN